MTTRGRRFLYWSGALFCLGALAGGAASAAPAYTVADLGTLTVDASAANGLSDAGRVAGEASFGDGLRQHMHAVVWDAHGSPAAPPVLDLGGASADAPSDALSAAPRRDFARAALRRSGPLRPEAGRAAAGPDPYEAHATNAWAYGVNDRGAVAGVTQVMNGTKHAVLWRGGRATDLGTLGGELSFAYGINRRDEVVGTAYTAQAGRHAFLWRDGHMTDLGTMVRTPPQTAESFAGDSTALAVNGRGEAVGFSDTPSGASHACLWLRERVVDLGTLGGTDSVARGLNDRRQVVGQSFTVGGDRHAFLWRAGKLEDINPFGSAFSDALGINDFGQVVGTAELPNGEYRAFVYRDGAAQDLNAEIATTSGWLLTEARAINDRGQIAGVGQISGQRHAFLLTPTSRPRLRDDAP